MEPPVPADPAIAPGVNPDPGQPRRAARSVLLLCLTLPVAILAIVISRAASDYSLEIPMRASTAQTTGLLYWHGNDKAGHLAAAVKLLPKPETVFVRFPLGSEDIKTLILHPTLGEGEIFVGAPVLRCAADNWLRLDRPCRDFTLADLQPLQNIASAAREGQLVHFVTTPHANQSACAIALPTPLQLEWSSEAFARNFAPLALAWVALVLGWYFAAAWLATRFPGLRQSWPWLVRRLLGTGPEKPLLVPRWEKYTVLAIFLLVAVVQANAILHGGTKGQDYPELYRFSEAIAAHPERPWKFGAQDPPVFVLTNALLIWLAHGVHGQELCGAWNGLVNLVALWIFTLLTRRFVAGAVWRVALLTLVAFLPVRLIQTVVLAGDALTLWPFFTLAWALAAITDQDTSRTRRRALTAVTGMLLTLGVLTKYTFMSTLVAVAITLVQLARRQRIPWREAGLLLALSLLLPVGVIIGQQREHPDFAKAMQFQWTGASSMSVSDVLWVHRQDAHIFTAPPYNEPFAVEKRAANNGKPWNLGPPYELLIEHRYSYLALNHLAIFTDVLNIFQYDPTDAYFGARSERNQRLMAVAVKTAAPITLTCMGAVALLSILAITTGLLAPARSRADLEAVYLLGFGWFSNIVVFLPFIPPAYQAGYWTPRLTMPGLLIFLLFTVYVIERLLPDGTAWRTASWLVLGYAVFQSALQVAFLWPWGAMY